MWLRCSRPANAECARRSESQWLLAWMVSRDRSPLYLGVLTLACFGVVLVPLLVGSVLTRRQPQRWRKSRLATATWLILALWFLVSAWVWYSLFADARSAHDATDMTSEATGIFHASTTH